MRRGLAVLAAALSLSVLAGCGGDAKDSSSSDFTPGGTPASTASGTPSPSASTSADHVGGPVKVTGSPETIAKRREVEQAWVDFYKAYTDAAAVPDPALADWRSRMTATGYKNLKNNIAALEKDDQHQVGPVTIDPVVLVVQARTAVVLDCIDGSRLKIVSRSGKTVQKGPKGLVPFNVRLVREGSAWLVDSIGGEDPNGRCSR